MKLEFVISVGLVSWMAASLVAFGRAKTRKWSNIFLACATIAGVVAAILGILMKIEALGVFGIVFVVIFSMVWWRKFFPTNLPHETNEEEK